MSESDSEEKYVIASNDAIKRNEVFNKTEPNLKDFGYEEFLNNCVNDLFQ